MLIDDFNDNSLDLAIWTRTNSTDISITESSAQINFASDGSYSGSLNVASLVSVANFEMQGRKFEIDIISTNGLGQFASASSGMQAGVQDSANSNNFAAIFIDQNQINFRRSNNGSNSTSTVAASGSDTKWRIEHNQFDNTWHFWTLTSGVWTRRFISAAANWTPSSCKVALYGYIYGSNSVSRTSSFDNPSIDEATIPAPQRASFQPFFAQ